MIFHRLIAALLLCAGPFIQAIASPIPQATMRVTALAEDLRVGDLVFIRIPSRPFREVADASGSWTNHVGVVTDVSTAEPQVAESRLPWSGTTTLTRFAARSEGGRLAVARLDQPLTVDQQARIHAAASRREGVLYDTGFNLHSKRQFCSRFVREVIAEATGREVGEVETFAALLAQRPDARLGFWRTWYFGHIPWQRETVTPASMLRSPELMFVFDGVAAP